MLYVGGMQVILRHRLVTITSTNSLWSFDIRSSSLLHNIVYHVALFLIKSIRLMDFFLTKSGFGFAKHAGGVGLV